MKTIDSEQLTGVSGGFFGPGGCVIREPKFPRDIPRSPFPQPPPGWPSPTVPEPKNPGDLR
jgi:hypothetical protein